MKTSTLLNKTIPYICIVATLISILGLVLTSIYIFHRWNDYAFHSFHTVDDYCFTYVVITFLFLLYWIFFFVLRKKKNTGSKMTKAIIRHYWIAGAILSLGIFSVAAINYATERKHIKNYTLDCQLTSPDLAKQHEAIDSIISIYVDQPHLFYDYGGPEGDSYKFMVKHARMGYPPAQNWVGVSFHNSAKRINDDAHRYDKGYDFVVPEAATELDRATYWFMRAAKSGNGSGQQNLGLMYGHFILSNLPYDRYEAEKWLLRAAGNKHPEAYLYLGRLYEPDDIVKAQTYWREGASKGNEDCMSMLERPEFVK